MTYALYTISPALAQTLSDLAVDPWFITCFLVLFVGTWFALAWYHETRVTRRRSQKRVELASLQYMGGGDFDDLYMPDIHQALSNVYRRHRR